jgi:hypothetical protein
MDIEMRSPYLEVIEIKRKITAELFKDLKVGHKIRLSQIIEKGRSGYVAKITVTNDENGKKITKTMHELCNILDSFRLVSVNR